MDARTRGVVFPEKFGIWIDGLVTGDEIAMPSAVRKADGDREQTFTVPYSFVDLNGHMNNSRYFDLAEDCIGAAAAGALLKEIAVEYQNEARLAETLSLRWGLQDTGNPEEQFYILSGRTARDVFRMSLRYE